MPRWGEVDPVWLKNPWMFLVFLLFPLVFIILLLVTAGSTFLALLPPPCYCSPQNLNFSCPVCIPAAEPPMVVYTFSIWGSEYSQSWAHMELLWPGFSLHCCSGLLGKTQFAPSGLCWEKHLCHPLCHSPWSSLVPVPGTAAGECWQALSHKNPM